MSKLKLLVAFAIGYVAGAAAGRQRYEQIRTRAQKVAESPRVQSAAKRAGDTVAEKAPVVAAVVKDKTVAAASAVADKVKPSGDGEAGAPAHPNGSVPLS
jgi:hypothetical protein